MYYVVLLQSQMASATLLKGERFPGIPLPIQFIFSSRTQFHSQSARGENVI